VIEQTDQFQKFGKTMARKYEFKKQSEKSDLNKKKLIFLDLKIHDFSNLFIRLCFISE